MTPVILTLAALAVVYALVAWGSWWRASRDVDDFDEEPTYSIVPPTQVSVRFIALDRRAEIALRVRDGFSAAGELEPTFAAVLAEVERLVVA